MSHLTKLKPGDSVEIIAPASSCSEKHLENIKQLLISWGLNCIVDDKIFGEDLLCANSDENRFELLKNALLRPETKAIICARGGYGCMRLIPQLLKIKPPTHPKLFLGMSDVTALNIFLQQEWGWSTLHGSLSLDKFSAESILAIKSFLFGEVSEVTYEGVSLNYAAEKNSIIESTLIGGNLCLVQASIGTSWQLNGSDKIIFLEEVNERGYKIDRMLEHLSQANMFKNVRAILLGDFIGGEEPNGSSLVQPVLERFAKAFNKPVVQIKGVGHDNTNFPLPLGTHVKLLLGKISKIIAFNLIAHENKADINYEYSQRN